MAFPLLFAIGTGLTVAGQLGAGQAASKAATAQALEAIRAGVFARFKAYGEAADIREAGEKFVARQYTAFAKSGVVLDTGSPLLTMTESYRLIERDAIRTEHYGEEMERQKRMESDALYKQARASATSAALGAMGTMLTAGAAWSKFGAGGGGGVLKSSTGAPDIFIR